MNYERMSTSGDDDSGLTAQAVMVGLITTVFLVLVISALAAALVYFTQITEDSSTSALYYAGLACVAVGGAFSARRSGKLGWLHGAVVGLLYASLSIALTFLIMPGPMVILDLLGKIASVAVLGALGGIIGVNL